MARRLTIAIDGPAGSGKSTVARRVAAMLGYLYLDSGAMYRAVALKALERKMPLEDEAALEALTRETHIELKAPTPEQEAAGLKNRVFLDGREVTDGNSHGGSGAGGFTIGDDCGRARVAGGGAAEARARAAAW